MLHDEDRVPTHTDMEVALIDESAGRVQVLYRSLRGQHPYAYRFWRRIQDVLVIEESDHASETPVHGTR